MRDDLPFARETELRLVRLISANEDLRARGGAIGRQIDDGISAGVQAAAQERVAPCNSLDRAIGQLRNMLGDGEIVLGVDQRTFGHGLPGPSLARFVSRARAGFPVPFD